MRPATKRIHVTGGPGAGKTTLARLIATRLDAPTIDLDGILLGAHDDVAGLIAHGHLERLSMEESWVSDGVYIGWTSPLFERADRIVLIDTPAPTALYRIAARHVRAEFRRDNRFPGWRRFFGFLAWSARYYRDANVDALDAIGVPETRSRAHRELERYRDRLDVCRGRRDIERLLRSLIA